MIHIMDKVQLCDYYATSSNRFQTGSIGVILTAYLLTSLSRDVNVSILNQGQRYGSGRADTEVWHASAEGTILPSSSASSPIGFNGGTLIPKDTYLDPQRTILGYKVFDLPKFGCQYVIAEEKRHHCSDWRFVDHTVTYDQVREANYNGTLFYEIHYVIVYVNGKVGQGWNTLRAPSRSGTRWLSFDQEACISNLKAELSRFFTDANMRQNEHGVDAAFQVACSGLEYVSTNSVANVIQAAALCKELVLAVKSGKPIGSVKRAKKLLEKAQDHKVAAAALTTSDMWLWYRYSYCTTKSDLKDYFKQIPRLLHEQSKRRTTYGNASYKGGKYVCSVTAVPTSSSMSSNLDRVTQNLGLSLTAQNAWDLVPFSFVVDWFTPMSEFCQCMDFDARYNLMRYSFERICYSFTLLGESKLYPGVVFKWYHRWDEKFPRTIYSWYSDYNPSTKTITKRAIDATTLLVEKRR